MLPILQGLSPTTSSVPLCSYRKEKRNHVCIENRQAGQRRNPSESCPRRRRRAAAVDPHLGAAELPASRQADQAGPDRLVRPGHAPRRHRRAMVRQHHRSRQRRPRARRRSELLRLRGRAIPVERRRRGGGSEDRRPGDLGEIQAMASLLEVLRQHGPHPASHAPAGQARRLDRPTGQARVLLLPPAIERRREPLRLHLHGPGAGHDEGRRPPLPGRTGTRATTASSISRRRIA